MPVFISSLLIAAYLFSGVIVTSRIAITKKDLPESPLPILVVFLFWPGSMASLFWTDGK